ncbi:nesprin-1 [Caerostris extrusa]|uniref:Nesprin-1 n=1 Tax=Caerostris extrusa TaxID=172846 RepID=A0AAV4XZP2_CAEEX|nr:nesprin-1 [Caerostris extrusa]
MRAEYLNRPQSFKEFLKELNSNKQQLASFQNISSKLQDNYLLHLTAKENVETQLNTLQYSFKSLEEVLNYYNQKAFDLIRGTNADLQTLQSAQEFLNDTENNFIFDKPHSKQDLENSLTATMDALAVTVNHCSAVDYIRRNLLFDEKINFEISNGVSRILMDFQQTTSRLTSHYLNLFKVYSESNSLIENILCILKFLKYFKAMFACIPFEYSELLKFFMNIQLMDVYIHAHRPIVYHINRECLKKSRSKDTSNTEQLVECLKKLTNEWDSLENVYRDKTNKIRRDICLWETYLHCINDVKIWIDRSQKELKCYQNVQNPKEMEDQISILQKLVDEQEMFTSMFEKAKHVQQSKKIQIEIENLKDISSILNTLEYQVKDIEEKMPSYNYYTQINLLREIIRILNSVLNEHVKHAEALIEKQNFEEMYKTLLKWNELTEAKLNRHYRESPENIQEKMQTTIKNEVLENSNLLQQIAVVGESMKENAQKSDFVSAVISSSTSNVSQIGILLDLRNQALQKILKLKTRTSLLQEKVENFLTGSEQSLHIPIQFTEVSLTEVDGLIEASKNLQKDIQLQNENMEILTNDMCELMTESDAFSSTNIFILQL